ncbi:MAG: hypothetical protein GEEBNDBF_00103 [bacterium]|nr:hypothetical protein [bacterium]
MKSDASLADLRNLPDQELGKKYSELKRKLYDARMRIQGLPSSEIRRTRRTVAQLLTIARERGLRIS